METETSLHSLKSSAVGPFWTR